MKKEDKKKAEEVPPLIVGIVETPLGALVKVLHQKYRTTTDFAPMNANSPQTYYPVAGKSDSIFISDKPTLTAYNIGRSDAYVQIGVRGVSRTYDYLACIVQKKDMKYVIGKVKEMVAQYNKERMAYEAPLEEEDLDSYTCEVEKCQ